MEEDCFIKDRSGGSGQGSKEAGMPVMDKKKWYLFFKRDKFAVHAGIELEDISPGWARVKCDVQEHHLNGVKCVHGGMLFTLADMAFAAAANSHGRLAVALNATISFVKPARGKTLTAEAREVSRSGRHAVYEVRVFDEAGDTVSACQGMAYVTKEDW
jgi:acyl-CoA thioesterase